MTNYKKYDISLYGHITIDRIFVDFDEHKSIGAMGNVWDALVSTDSTLSIKLKPSAIGEAIVLVDKKNTKRLGRGQLNLKKNNITNIPSSKWHHIMYLNQLEDVSFIENIKNGIISADITAGEMKNSDMLKHIDYLFISDEDLFMDIDELAKMVKGWVILHYPEGSYSSNGKESFTLSNEALTNIDVLGAGDFFAASFMYRGLYEDDIKKCVMYAHLNTTKLLVGRGNGKKG
jgi:hypothetical protein